MNKPSVWILILGAVLLILGVVSLLTGFGPEQDQAALTMGSLLFSLGSLLVGLGFYLKARELESSMRPGKGPELVGREDKRMPKCTVCGGPSSFRCTTHLVNVCGTDLIRHDEGACAYIPLNRKAGRASAVGAWR